MTYYDKWALDTVWTSGERLGNPTKLTPTEAQVRQGFVGAESFKGQHVNWMLRHVMDNLNAMTFGDGSAGAVAYGAGLHVLSEDIYATTVDVEAGSTIEPNGYRIFATESITITGDIDSSAAVYTAESSSAAGVGVGNGVDGNYERTTGGDGGHGGDAGGWVGGFRGDRETRIGNIQGALSLTYRREGAVVAYVGGGGGGSGAGDDGGDVSGVGGRGGGIVMLAAREIIWNGGTVNVAGTDGGDAPSTGTRGGGGGGGGGSVVIVARTITGTPSYDLSGGAGGAGQFADDGLPGSDGELYIFEV